MLRFIYVEYNLITFTRRFIWRQDIIIQVFTKNGNQEFSLVIFFSLFSSELGGRGGAINSLFDFIMSFLCVHITWSLLQCLARDWQVLSVSFLQLSRSNRSMLLQCCAKVARAESPTAYRNKHVDLGKL